MTDIVLEPLAENSPTSRNFQKVQALWIKGPAQARVYNSADITTASGTPKVLTFNSERYDTGGFHSTSANTSRLTAPTAGLYSIGCGVRFAATTGGYRQVEIVLNGTTVIATCINPGPSPAGLVTDINLDTQYQLAAGDYVEVRVTQNGGTPNVTAAANTSPEFWIVRLGSQG